MDVLQFGRSALKGGGMKQITYAEPNLTRRRLFAIPLLLSISMISGCIQTSSLFANHTYKEHISSILISADKKYFVILTPNWHYVFDAPPGIVESLTAPFHKDISADFSTLVIDEYGNAYIYYTLIIPELKIQSNKNKLIEIGYKEKLVGKKVDMYAYKAKYGDLYLTGKMRGTRYSSNHFVIPAEMILLNRAYEIEVSYPQSTLEKVEKLPLTPITLAADGVILIGMVPLALVWLTVASLPNASP
jgi:hypothetical protein